MSVPIRTSSIEKMRQRQRQRGSTLTGLIIGLIIGLGIAVLVALLITKGASPFTEKTAKQGRPADLGPNQASDPNKPLYGNRDAAREASRQLADKDKDKSADKPARAADADPLGKAIAAMKDRVAAPAAPAAAPAPAPAAPAAAALPATPAAASGEDRMVYYLQAGAFRELSDAENTRAKLALLGFEAAISERASDSGVLHRVRVGPYAQVETMNKARAKLLDSGVDVAIVRNQR